jgi:hypothetical protein
VKISSVVFRPGDFAFRIAGHQSDTVLTPEASTEIDVDLKPEIELTLQ